MILRSIEQIAAVTRPGWDHAAGVRDQHPAASVRESAHVHLVGTAFGIGIGYPFSVGRDRGIPLERGRFKKRSWLARAKLPGATVHVHHAKLSPTVRTDFGKNKLRAVRGK